MLTFNACVNALTNASLYCWLHREGDWNDNRWTRGCRRKVIVVTEWQQNNFSLLEYYSVIKKSQFNGIL